MCTNCRYIWNRYSRRSVLVKCGHCDACLQEKATRRAQRIKNNLNDGTIALFCTFTYTNDYVPFIYRSDLVGYGDLNVYRSADVRYIYDRHSNLVRLRKDVGIHPIAMVNQFDIDCQRTDVYHHLNGMSKDKIGVCWYPDIQEFYKRLRITLQRKYNYEDKFSYFTCSELGSHTQRPHFHALIFIKRDDEATFRSAICEAWPYADKARTSRYIEIAKDAANYVASYVNCHSDVLPLLQSPMFKPKHSSSKDFGVVLDCFSLRSILEKIDRRDLQYYRKQKFDGQSTVVSMPVPLYVLHRYFPICKGFGWLSAQQLHSVLLSPERIGDILTDFTYLANYDRVVYDSDSFTSVPVPILVLHNKCYITRSCKLNSLCYSYSPRETYAIYVRLENCYQRFHSETGLSRYDYAFYYEQVYSIYHSMILRLSLESVENLIDFGDFYENALELFENPSLSPTLANLNLTIDPNKRKDIVFKTDTYRRLYSRLDKQKSVTNFCMSRMGYNV